MYQSLPSSTLPILDLSSLYSKTDILSGIITLPPEIPPSKHLLKHTLTQELVHVHLHHSSQIYNHHTSCSFVLDLSVEEKLTYISTHSPDRLHEYTTCSSKQVILKLPDMLQGHRTFELFLNDQLSIIPTTHTIHSTLLDAHNIYRRALLSLEVKKTH